MIWNVPYMDFNTVGNFTKFYGHVKISVTLVNAIFCPNQGVQLKRSTVLGSLKHFLTSSSH